MIERLKKIGRVKMLLLPAIISLFQGCSYSFKGGSVPAHLKTIAIPIVQDQSGYGYPELRDSFTQKLVERFTNDNTLELTDRNTADSMLEGIITEVKDNPLVLQGGEQVAERRITITVHVTFQDLKLRKKIWEKNFNNWGNYPSGGGLTQRDEGIQAAVEKITEDILNDTVAGW
jgi:outer membrane lipopolysaccharide assembly protein LptE/RlpB